jgi:BirA family biotin operon repressor/biotin-[acetyl-CoA-carboxylase] ligase
MLPTGIFLLNSDPDSFASPADTALISGFHPLWSNDIVKFDPWESYQDSDEAVQGFLKSTVPSDSTIILTGPCSTTMEVARNFVQSEMIGEWGSVISVEQSSGRGQLRRPWVSLPGNLHASIVMPAPPVRGEWGVYLKELLPLVVGYIFGDVLDGLGASVQVKWPNDLLQNGRKIGGMLIEEKNNVVILGLGLNIADSPSDDIMREDCSVLAAKLQIPNVIVPPLTLLEHLVNRGKSVYSVLLDEFTPTQFISAAVDRLAWLGQNVLVREGGQSSYEAVVTGLSPKGGLVLRRNGREVVLYSGSIFPL